MKRAVTWLGIAVSAALVFVIASQLDLARAMGAIRAADGRWLLAATLLYVSLFPLRGLRWAVLLRPIQKVSVASATSGFAIGFMANNVLPARLGDVARAFVLGRREGIPVATTFANVMLERIFDGLTVVAILALSLELAPPPARWVDAVSLGMAALFGGALLASILIARSEDRVVAIARALLAWLPPRTADRIEALLRKVGKGLALLDSAGRTIMVLALSIVIWSLEVAVYLLLQEAFGMSVSVLGMAAVMGLLTLGLTAPSAPGFIGVFEGTVIVGVTLFGVPAATAAAFAITLHLIHYIPGTLLGLVLAWQSGVRLREAVGGTGTTESTWTSQSSEPDTSASWREPASPRWATTSPASTTTKTRSDL
jgi:hypothetical protein